MSLPLVDYASSDDASDDEQTAVSTAQRGAEAAENKQSTQVAGNAAVKPSKLPSAAQMFGSKAKSSSMVAPSVPAPAVAPAAPKAAARSEVQAASATKNAAEKPAAAQDTKMFVPPQMMRPNKVTEDTAAWTTQRKHRSSGQEAEQSSKRPKAEAKS